ncbi:hypothetical protein DASB73_006710 [Starmerella bacillaris]|uniref:Uncharacterized protein n=1 Tax=Starmerella bacillaris TaxID=1247836 RepID=A0AAV5RE22_STABA|nr:hypothetical protein DASB73_006710 [Starmerella bacillaris]
MSEYDRYNTAPHVFKSRVVLPRNRDACTMAKKNNRGKLTMQNPIFDCFKGLVPETSMVYPESEEEDLIDVSNNDIPSPQCPLDSSEVPELGNSSAETTPDVDARSMHDFTYQAVSAPSSGTAQDKSSDNFQDSLSPKSHNEWGPDEHQYARELMSVIGTECKPRPKPSEEQDFGEVSYKYSRKNFYDIYPSESVNDDSLIENEPSESGTVQYHGRPDECGTQDGWINRRFEPHLDQAIEEDDLENDHNAELCGDGNPYMESCFPTATTNPSPQQSNECSLWAHPISLQRKMSPLSSVRKDLSDLKSPDAFFTVALDRIFTKMVIALNERESAYLFRDFAGHFTTFLDRFGPGGYDSHRAPPSASWMLKLIMPWFQIEESANDTHVSTYAEVSSWARRITEFLGEENWQVMLEEGPLDLCIEHVAYANHEINESAYQTIKVIVQTLPIRHELLYKILLIKTMSFGFESNEMAFLRHHRLRLINQFVERMDSEKSKDNQELFLSLLNDILNDLDNCNSWETDKGLCKSVKQCMEFASKVYKSIEFLDVKESSGTTTRSRAPRLSLNVNSKKFADIQISDNCVSESDEDDTERLQRTGSTRQRVKEFFRRIFKRNREPKDLDRLEIMSTKSMPVIPNRLSMNTFRIPAHELPRQRSGSNPDLFSSNLYVD